VADADMDAIQDLGSFYSFEQIRAKEELEYRQELKKELDEFGNNIGSMGRIPRRN
jgi:hypothetical protein